MLPPTLRVTQTLCLVNQGAQAAFQLIPVPFYLFIYFLEIFQFVLDFCKSLSVLFKQDLNSSQSMLQPTASEAPPWLFYLFKTLLQLQISNCQLFVFLVCMFLLSQNLTSSNCPTLLGQNGHEILCFTIKMVIYIRFLKQLMGGMVA